MNNTKLGCRLAQTVAIGLVFSQAAIVQAQQTPLYPGVKNLGDAATFGKNIQRTMTLLVTSTPQKRNTVKVLFYGQSITEQAWWKTVADKLRQRFPHANLIIENRALGGFSSQRLWKTAESDLYSFYPDLMIFHVYGSHSDYETIIKNTRERTTSEILIQTDHITKDEDLTEETNPANIRSEGRMWNSFMNYKHLPEMARKYQTGITDQRNLWKQYLRDNNLQARQLLKDSVHLNAHGEYLMAELTSAYFVLHSRPVIDPYNCETVKTLVVGKDIHWQNGKLTLPFDGNRVDAIAKDGAAAPASILIDNRKPSEHAALYRFTRALATPGGKWPVILKIGSEKMPLLEEWTMQVKKDAANDKRFTFTVHGSKTGDDGAGSSDARFVSQSGRIVIEPNDWDVEYALNLPGIKPVPNEFVVKWRVEPLFVDEFVSPGVQDATVETVVTLAQGLKNGAHTLQISGTPQTPIAAIRVYRPLLGREGQ